MLPTSTICKTGDEIVTVIVGGVGGVGLGEGSKSKNQIYQQKKKSIGNKIQFDDHN